MSVIALLSIVILWHWPFVQPPVELTLFPDKAAARIVVSQDDQRMLIFEGERLFRALPVSTGVPADRVTTTPAWEGRVGRYWGTFSSFGTTQDHGYWLFTDYLPDGRWNGDILIHGAPYTRGADGEKLYQREHIGREPHSHGCIQLLPEDAEWFRAWDPVGVPVAIEPIGVGAVLPPLATPGPPR
jgi:lipoprotein-anchoring transpeptidase ErfK/SrfK